MKKRLLAFAMLLTVYHSAFASAGIINYTEVFNARGFLGNSSFSDARVTLEFSGDTNDIMPVAFGLGVLTSQATVTIADLGTATFTDPTLVFVSQQSGNTYLEFEATDNYYNQFAEIAVQGNTQFGRYDLTGQFGPLTGSLQGEAGIHFSTNLGDFLILDSSDDSTFTATPGVSVPEPSALHLAALGACGFGAYSLARRRKTEAVYL